MFMQQELKDKQKNIENKYLNRVDHFDLETKNILKTTRERINDTTNSLEQIKQSFSESIKNNLTELSQKSIELFQEEAKLLRNEHNQITNELRKEMAAKLTANLNNISSDTLSNIKIYREKLDLENNKMDEVINNYLKEKLSLIDKEIENYKEGRIHEIKNNFNKIIFDLSKKIFADSINLQIDEKLILKSLDQAKNDGFFEPKR
jgi:hypothetical protein